jgi:putative spermidine/putrescine transport system permease protein
MSPRPTALALSLLAPALLVLVVLLVLPLGYLIHYSFHEAPMGQSATGPATLANYREIFADTYYARVLFKTIWMSAVVTVAALLIGYPMAYFMWRWVRRWRGLITVVVLSPILVSIVVSAFGWTVLLGTHGLVNQLLIAIGLTERPIKIMHTDVAILIGLTHVALPFLILSVLAALERIDPILKEAARTLGAPRWQVFRHVVLPLSLPGIISGTTLAFSLSMATYVAPAVLGGSGANFISTLIYHHLIVLLEWPLGAAVAAVLLVVALTIVFAYLRFWSLFGGVAAQGRAHAGS